MSTTPTQNGPFIQVIQHEEAEGQLKEIYDDLVKSRGKLAEIHKIQSLNPEGILRHMDLYMTIMYGKSPLRRYQREMIAVVVSLANDCHYCQIHHGEALNHFWKDEAKLKAFYADFRTTPLSDADKLLCEYAHQLTKAPSSIQRTQVDAMREAGLSDRQILDAAQVIAYFNFVNRLVLGLGVQLEADGGKGYDYE